jgi:ParB-like chromosome segregation protein Spo0J
MANKVELRNAIYIESKYKSLVPRPSKEEYVALKNSLTRDGQRDPVVVDEEGAILDGYTRFEILKEMGKDVKFETRTFPSEQAKEDFIIEAAVLRRNLNTFQKIELAQLALGRERARAKERQKRGKTTLASNDAKVGKAIAIVARRFGIPQPTFERGQFVIQNATAEQKAALRLGEATIGGIYEQLKGKRNSEPVGNSSASAGEIELASIHDNIDDLESEDPAPTIDRGVHCEGCDNKLTRGKVKRVLLCEGCRKNLGMSW